MDFSEAPTALVVTMHFSVLFFFRALSCRYLYFCPVVATNTAYHDVLSVNLIHGRLWTFYLVRLRYPDVISGYADVNSMQLSVLSSLRDFKFGLQYISFSAP